MILLGRCFSVPGAFPRPSRRRVPGCGLRGDSFRFGLAQRVLYPTVPAQRRCCRISPSPLHPFSGFSPPTAQKRRPRSGVLGAASRALQYPRTSSTATRPPFVPAPVSTRSSAGFRVCGFAAPAAVNDRPPDICTRMHTHTCTHTCAHTHSHIPIHSHIHTHASVHTHSHTHAFTHAHTQTHTHSQTCTHTHTHTHVHTHSHMRTHTHTHTHTLGAHSCPPHWVGSAALRQRRPQVTIRSFRGCWCSQGRDLRRG